MCARYFTPTKSNGTSDHISQIVECPGCLDPKAYRSNLTKGGTPGVPYICCSQCKKLGVLGDWPNKENPRPGIFTDEFLSLRDTLPDDDVLIVLADMRLSITNGDTDVDEMLRYLEKLKKSDFVRRQP